MPCCCKAPQHVAVGSRAESSAVAPKTARMDRGFDDDKAAVQRWREQHSPVNASDQKNQQALGHSGSGPDDSDSDSDSSCQLVINDTKTPVVLSAKAVQAWQQTPSKQPETETIQRASLKEELRSPYEISFSESMDSQQQQQQQQEKNQQPTHSPKIAGLNKPPRTQNVFRTAPALLDKEEAVLVVTPDSASATHRLQEEHQKLDALVQSSPKSSPTSPLFRRRHDHDGIRDQLIRDVVLNQDTTTTTANQEETLRNQTFLQINHRAPRQYDFYEDDTTTSISATNSISDIFSDPALEDVAHSMTNDSESRERYILACRLLRSRITQKQPTPILPMERELLEDLKDRFQASKSGGSAVAYETLSSLLENDEERNNNRVGISPIPEGEETENDSGIAPISISRTHSSGHRLSVNNNVSLDGEVTVSSIRDDDEGFNQTVLRQTLSASSWRDEKNAKALPELLEEEERKSTPGKLPVEEPTTKLIRLDGWNSSLMEQYPFQIMGLDQDTPPGSRVLTPALMEALRGFLPYSVSEDNFWLKFSLVRDGSSLRVLLRNVMASQHTIICVETQDGHVFGSFCSSPWRNNEQQKWFGTGEAFLWKLKQSRYVPETNAKKQRESKVGNEMEVYPYTTHDDMVQYCSSTSLAVGGGSWNDTPCPYPGEPTGIGLLLDGDLEGGETNSCATFANPRLYGRDTKSNEFTVRNCEVWTLTPMNTINEAEQLERQKYFIKEHSEPMSRPDASPRRARPPLPPIR